MKGIPKPFDSAKVLSRLKDFQRTTVDYVFDRLYGKDNPVDRFLVADEVGLGKTLVARGLIARTIDHLWDDVDRIDIVYICSNAAIARQNVSRLNPTLQEDFNLATRITLLPLQLKGLKSNHLNFISFTPGTSFELKSAFGTVRERALLYCLLREAWDLPKEAEHVLQGGAELKTFRSAVSKISDDDIDPDLADAFRSVAAEHPDIRDAFVNACRDAVRHDKVTKEERKVRAQLVGTLRGLLAATCLGELEPDLIIMDEFQRFKQLLDGDDEASTLAKHLFGFHDKHGRPAKVVLLSATPYKMYTMAHEAEQEDHYDDFLRTVRFLEGAGAQTEDFCDLLKDFRQELLNSNDSDGAPLRSLAIRIENRLRHVIARTERLGVTEDRSGMLKTVDAASFTPTAHDLRDYIGLQRVASSLDQGDPIDYWKSAAYMLNFMDDYKLKELLKAHLAKTTENATLTELLKQHPALLLAWKDIEAYKRVDPGNCRLRTLETSMIDSGAWQTLWLPPTLPYYQLSGPFSNPTLHGLTKRLVFSSWKVVPKVISMMLSYEVERRMTRLADTEVMNIQDDRKKRKALLKFSRAEGRLTGMPVLALVYPCSTLANAFDHLVGPSSGALKSDELVAQIARELEPMLAEIPCDATRDEDEAWYWAAPILLDKRQGDVEASRAWFNQPDLETLWGGTHSDSDAQSNLAEDDDPRTAWADHVEHAHECFVGGRVLGKPPADLAFVLARMALASPGVASIRSLTRIAGQPDGFSVDDRIKLRNTAGAIAHSTLSLFNAPDVISLIQGLASDKKAYYWRKVLDYCVDGCYQAVVDEYLHLLPELLGLIDKPLSDLLEGIEERFTEVMRLRTANLGVDEIGFNQAETATTIAQRGMRCRFASRYGDDRSDEGGDVTRGDQVAAAFNSPFWPFVLATTSVGQEGLDFHPYCHAVVHWNLPANPVDLEQREGRVHRYKGHAVRKNIAQVHGSQPDKTIRDVWSDMFNRASGAKTAGASDLVPYWIYSVEGGARIERHVLATPLSRDTQKLLELRQSLAVYRMVFGQSRQDELLEYLVNRVGPDNLPQLVEALRIDLSPRSLPARTPFDS